MAKILALTGEKLGGKDTVAEYLVKRYGATHVRHSHILDDILRILDMPISRRNEIDLAMSLRGVFGTGIIGKALQKRIEEVTLASELIVMNGIRFQEELDDAKNLGAKIIYITASEEIRYQRFLNRNEKTDDTTQTTEEFRRQEQEPTEIGIPKIGEQADYRIENTGTLDTLYLKIEELIKNM